MISLGLIMLVLVCIASIIDFKTGVVPSALLSMLILIPLSVNIGMGLYGNVFLGALAFVYAIFLFDLDYFGGIGDVKVLSAMGLMTSSIYQLGFLIIMTLIVGIMWKSFWYIHYKRRKKDIPNEFPFIPVFFIVNIIMLLTGGYFG